LENASRFQAVGIDPSQACRATVGYQDLSVLGDDAGSFREARQRCDMTPDIVIDDFDAVPSRVRHENAARLGIESTMIERAACGGRYLDYA
jgi:hypothetical protein